MAAFFIDRPVFAWVIAIVIMLIGSLSLINLPISQYPEIAPPQVTISAAYPGASAKIIEDSVTQVIEQNMNGIDNLLYMSSQSSSSGAASITLTFEAGTDPDIAQVQVQNKLQQVSNQIPQVVNKLGIQVAKASSTMLMVLGVVSADGSMDRNDLADFMVSTLKDPLSRTEGVGSIRIFGSQYAMRIWLDPHKLNSHGLTPADVSRAISVQNNQVSVGNLGGSPSVLGIQYSASMMAQTMMTSPEEFENIMLKVSSNGSQVRLKDVARVEIGGEDYSVITHYNGKEATGIGIMLATGANALETAENVRAKVAELQPFFPAGIKIVYPYDTTQFIKISIEEVAHTLIEAVVLVFLVMFLFLQNFRATIIPTIAIPVVLLGTFGVMAALGFSINTLTMFGLVLAIGLLVDDAIVVVENVERIMDKDGLSPYEATKKSMTQITSALVGIAVVLSAVFVPMAFFGGATGAIYRQFSITIVTAMALSVVVAIVLTPALCATMLKPKKTGGHAAKKGFFGWFNRMFTKGTNAYGSSVALVLKRSFIFSIIFLILFGSLLYLFKRLPTSFLPNEDQGVMISMTMLPAGASLERTEAVMEKIQNYYLHGEKEAVESIFTISGFSFAGNGQNMGLSFIKLKDWDQRLAPNLSVDAVIGRSYGFFSTIKEAMVFAFNLPPIISLGNSTGFDLFLQDRGGIGHKKLIEARNMLLGMAAQDPRLTAVRPNGMEDTPQYILDIDYEKAMALGISVHDINSTLSTAWGSSYVNDFLHNERIKKVYLQADAKYRMKQEDIYKWHVRNNQGEMVPFSAFVSGHWGYGSPRLERYNGSPAVQIQGQAAPGLSSGDAMSAIEEIVAKLPGGVGFEWTGSSFQEKRSGDQAPALYALSILVVFLSLAALYESWSIPFSVILAIPLGVLGALTATFLRGLENDIYFQVGLLTTIGLTAKNAILIVEFAKKEFDKGKSLTTAAVDACKQRLRPILMTSFAFILGVLPLAVSTGAGANARHAVGTGVIGGMLSATVLAILFIPLFFVIIMRLFKTKQVNPKTIKEA
ncbi:MAG: hydrophobe/amphiphile efflux-1 family RND transporter [Deltaproteobacteria bacterium]|nr:MAG: hydrophobe/amphiphile efflux-1 family RND transporter [Deltaproteobacteria bacterium]